MTEPPANPEPSVQTSPALPNRRQLRRRFVILVIAGLILTRLILMFGGPAKPVGVVDGRLRPCPDSPNCVCSQDVDAEHAIAPLRYADSAPAAWKRLHQTIAKMPRTRVVTADDHYLHVEFTTMILRFVDDVEFLLDPAGGVIQIRSASRIGHSDLGTNRKRMEELRKSFEADLSPSP